MTSRNNETNMMFCRVRKGETFSALFNLPNSAYPRQLFSKVAATLRRGEPSQGGR